MILFLLVPCYPSNVVILAVKASILSSASCNAFTNGIISCAGLNDWEPSSSILQPLNFSVSIPSASIAAFTSCAINPVSFNLIGSPVHKAGFIAQEVETVKSSLVNGGEEDEDGNETIRGVDYYGILAHAVKTIQELEARITTLEG